MSFVVTTDRRSQSVVGTNMPRYIVAELRNDAAVPIVRYIVAELRNDAAVPIVTALKSAMEGERR